MAQSPEKLTDIEKITGRIRREYHFGRLDRRDLVPDPFEQFVRWFQAAVKRRTPNANVMVLATAGKGKVSARCVLLKGIRKNGLLFYSQTKSLKARQLEENPKASACFYWPEMERQVIVTGRVKKIPRKQAALYFKSRPRAAQIAAWCSDQSRVVKDRKTLDRRFEEIKKRFEGRAVPLSPSWCGFCLEPKEFEFWQGRENRLNDRFRYQKSSGRWIIERLQP